MSVRTKVEDVLAHAEYIRAAIQIDKLAVTKEKAVLRNLGLSCSEPGSESDDDTEESESCQEAEQD